MGKRGIEELKKHRHPATEGSKFRTTPWMFAKGKEKETKSVVNDDDVKRAVKPCVLSSDLCKGMRITAYDGNVKQKTSRASEGIDR